jgi:CheY-like chemotaxis protein
MALRVVVLDNDPAVLELLELDMRLEGHDVVASVATGEDALRACGDLSPDVLVADLRLGPGIDGLEVVQRAPRPGPRLVLHTNYVTRELVEAADRAGAVVVEKGSLGALRRAVRG